MERTHWGTQFPRMETNSQIGNEMPKIYIGKKGKRKRKKKGGWGGKEGRKRQKGRGRGRKKGKKKGEEEEASQKGK